MGWETRKNRRYFYRVFRNNGEKKRHYIGAGRLGSLASKLDKLRRAERAAAISAESIDRARYEEAEASCDQLWSESDLLITSSLLAAGFRRPGRHRWRKWKNAELILSRRR